MFELKSCHLAEIDFADRSFPFSWGPVPEVLTASLAAVGIRQPVSLLAGERGLVIVSGRRRLEALRSLPAGDPIPYFEVSEGDRDRLFLEVFWENVAIREFNPVESAELFLVIETRFSGRQDLVKPLLAHLGIPAKPRFRQRCRALVGFSGTLRELIAEGRMDGETIDLLAAWPEDDRAELEALARDLNLRRNKLREVVGRLDDISRRDRVPIPELIAEAREIMAAVAEPEQVNRLRRHLKERLYPHLTAAYREFAVNRDRLSLPAGVVIEPPPDFEGGDFRAGFTFSDSRDWQKIITRLQALSVEEIDELCRRP